MQQLRIGGLRGFICVESATAWSQWHGAHRLVQECIHSEFVMSLNQGVVVMRGLLWYERLIE